MTTTVWVVEWELRHDSDAGWCSVWSTEEAAWAEARRLKAGGDTFREFSVASTPLDEPGDENMREARVP